MENEFISYQEAGMLKLAGFNEPCSAKYILGEIRHYDKSSDAGIYLSYTKDGKEVKEYSGRALLSKLGYIISPDLPLPAPTYLQAFNWLKERGYNVKSLHEFTRLQDIIVL